MFLGEQQVKSSAKTEGINFEQSSDALPTRGTQRIGFVANLFDRFE